MLPPALLDVVSLRLSTRLYPTISPVKCPIRRVQRLVAQHVPDEMLRKRTSGTSTRDGHTLKVQQNEKQIQAVTDLEARVAALKEAAEGLDRTAESTQEGPYFPELALQDIYKDLLAYPDPSLPQEQSPIDVATISAADIVQNLWARLPELEAAARGKVNSEEGLAARLQARLPRASPNEWKGAAIGHGARTKEDISTLQQNSSLREMIHRLRVVLETHRTNWLQVKQENVSSEATPATFRLLTSTEWYGLTEACLHAQDVDAAEAVLDLMKNADLLPSNEQCDMVLRWLADKGLVERADSHVVSFTSGVPRDLQRDLLIKARIMAGNVEDACALLHTYETHMEPVMMKSYTRVIQALLHSQEPGATQRTAQAWDLFAHMRYVAHAVPDAFLYSTMIRAAPEPQRALDLFTEMTIEQGIVPDTHAYTAVIRACARSKKFALQAFRIARDMLNSHRDARGKIPAHLRPDIHTFLGLLEAAKRIGSLSRARWVFAEIAAGARNVDNDEDHLVYVDERALIHMFHAYAAYRPPFRREAVSLERSKQQPLNGHPDGAEDAPSQDRDVQSARPIGPRGLPQSRGEVIREVTSLWERAVYDRERPHANQPLVFGRVHFNTRLINAYLVVHFMHSPPSEAYKLYHTLYEKFSVRRDAFSYVVALEAHAGGRRNLSPGELSVVLSAARSIWDDWLEQDMFDVRFANSARLVERAWSAMIRLLTLADNIQEAEGLLRRFVELYPPELVNQPSPADPRRSNRIRLYAERPLVRLMEPSAVPEDRISPFFTFTDVALLHNRALTTGRMELVDYIKWVVSAYEGALRRRRETQLRGN